MIKFNQALCVVVMIVVLVVCHTLPTAISPLWLLYSLAATNQSTS